MGGFELLDPKGLWLLTGLLPLVALYILKVRRKRLRVGSTLLWQAAQRDLLAKSPFRKLVPELPLLLQILALLLLALALARPASRGRRIEGDHVAVVVDTSASMGTLLRGAEPGGETRLSAAQRAANDVLSRLAPGADVMIVEAERDARLVSPPDRDRRRLEAAIASLRVREVEGDLAAAVALAADRLRSLGGSRRLIVITDGALAHDAPLVAAGVDVQLVTVGDPQDNAAIVRIDVRAGADPVTRREQVQAFLVVKGYGDKPRDLFVTLTVDGAASPVASRRVLVPPGEKVPLVLTFEPAESDRGKGLVAQIASGDALAADDVAYARVPAGTRMPVVLATRDGAKGYTWFARALDADPNTDVQRLTFAQLGTANVDPDALVIVEGACPDTLPGRDAVIVLPEGAREGTTCHGVDVGPAVEAPAITSWEAGDPRLRFLTLDGVHVRKARLLGAQGASAQLVRSTAGTLIADASVPGRTLTILGFDVGESDWPLKASFVLFVRNVVEHARLARAQGAAGPARTGEPLRVAVPHDVASIAIEGPDLTLDELPAKEGLAIVPPLERAGLYTVRWTSPHVGSALFAVNLTSEAESDVRPRPLAVDARAAGAIAAPPSRVPDAHHEWGTWLAVIAALVLAFDVVWLTRAPASPHRIGPGLTAAFVGLLPLLYVAAVHVGIVRDTYLRFHAPWGVVLGAVLGLVLAWRLARLPARMSSFRRALVTALSSAAVLAAALAAASPEIGRPLDRLAVVVAVDRSRSVDLVPGAEARAKAELAVAEKGMRPDDRVGVVVFGAQASTEDPLRPRSELAPAQRVEVGRDGTDLEAAIRRSLAELPADYAGRIVLVSDGVQTRGDALSAATAALAANVPVDVVILDQKAAPDVRVVAVRAPAKANEGEPIDLRIVTSSAADADVEVQVSRDGEPLHRGRTRIAKGEDVLRLRELAPGPGIHRYDVAITALDPTLDATPEDNSGSAFVRVRGPAVALVLEGDPGKGAPLAAALEASGFRVEQRGTTGVPADLGGLVGFDLVVLSDIPAMDLAPSQIEALASYARDLGGGLLLMGGDRSMGPGGYARTPIEEVSPVSFDLKQERRRGSLAEVIAIDYSGSMSMTVGGHTKLELANEAAARSASLLGPGDRLGVEHVDTVVSWTVPMGPITDLAATEAKIRAVTVGGGGIYTDLALRAGYAALERESVSLKHLLLFADGADAEQLAGCRGYVKTAFDHGITTSVISLGRGPDTPELEVLSKLGGGRFYLIEDATKLPAVFTQETILAARSAIHEEPFQVTLGAPGPPTRAVDYASAPPLNGYVVTEAKPRATVLLAGPEGDPILATWAVGVGRAAAFASDYKDRWGAAWLRWPGGAQTLGQLARDTARKLDDPRVRLESDASGGELHVRADVVGDDGRAQSFRRLLVHVAGPDGFVRDVPLEAVAAGRYAASVPLSRPGTYVAIAKDEVTGEPVGTTGAVLTAGEELRPTGSDRALLTRVASLTGGKVRDTLAGLFEDRASKRFAYTPAATWLLLASGIAMVLAVAARRLGVPDVAAKWAEALRAWRAEEERRKAERAANEAMTARFAALEQQRLNEVMRARREQRTGKGAVAGWIATGGTPTATSTATTTPTATTTSSTTATSTATRTSSPNQPPSPTDRPLTAAEKLALKRRERRP